LRPTVAAMQTIRSHEEESTEDEGEELSKKPAARKRPPLPTTATAYKGKKTSKAKPKAAPKAKTAPKKAKGKSSKRKKASSSSVKE
jgi:hypothetical protein